MDVVEDTANICTYNIADDDESKNNNMDDENTITYLNLKEYPSYPHTSGRMGAMARDCPIGVEVFLLLLLLRFPQTLVIGCVFLVCACFFRAFFLALVCVWNELLIYLFYSSIDCDSKITSPTLVQNPHILCVSHLKHHQSQKKCCKFYGPEEVQFQ